MKHDCVLCTFKQNCTSNTAFLYARTPILRQIIISLFEEMSMPYRYEGELFRLDVDHAAAIECLRKRLSEAERADIRVSRERGIGVFGAPTLDQYGRHLDTAWFDSALRDDKFTTFFQPIVDSRTSSVFAHESLIRLFADRTYNGGEIIEAAVSRGSIHLFDSYARRLAIRNAGAQFIPGTKVFINFMPSSIYDPAFCMASAMEEMSRTPLKPQDIVFEVVESDEVRDVRHLQKICDYYRREGFGFALDDVGTGANSLQMVCDLKPDYIKLDKSLISHVSDPMYHGAVEKLAEFASQFRINVIAEGIETYETMQMVQQTGIYLMQGYYFAKPAATMTHQLASLTSDLKQMSEKLGTPVTPERTCSPTHLG